MTSVENGSAPLTFPFTALRIRPRGENVTTRAKFDKAIENMRSITRSSRSMRNKSEHSWRKIDALSWERRSDSSTVPFSDAFSRSHQGEISDPSNAAGYDASSNQLGIEGFSSEKPTNEFQSGCGWTPVYAAWSALARIPRKIYRAWWTIVAAEGGG